ncbi:MAG: N-acetylmuramic acid 6-phosphate etherase [Thermoprotei archaeon]|jgi:N-acetylmuramic acid 6-phosphate etherase
MTLITEESNPVSVNLDLMGTEEILKIINDEDKKVPLAVEKAIPYIAQAVEIIVTNIKKGGRVKYFGCGTSGRIGMLDASEWESTFSAGDLVEAFIGSNDDNYDEGYKTALQNVKENDVAIGLTASGQTLYVIGALEAAKLKGSKTISIISNPIESAQKLVSLSDIVISVITGPEIIRGSTRMKAGTAQKLVLNMISTAVMVKLGRVYGNMMIMVKPLNNKLRERAIRIIREITGVDDNVARHAYEISNDVRLASLIALGIQDISTAYKILEKNDWNLRKSIQEVLKRITI